MRIGVIGAGAIGGTIAALLDRAGHEVRVTARGAALEAIASSGLRLDGAWGTHTARVGVSQQLDDAPDLAFLCTKATDAADALAQNASALHGVPLVVAQNGLTGLAAAAEALPDSSCVGALALYAARYVSPGQITVTAPGATYLGAGSGGPTAAARDAAAVLAEAMPAHAIGNFTGAQWTKLVVNMVNAMPAVTGLSVQETIADARLCRVVTASMRETVRVGRAAGVRFGTLESLRASVLAAFSHAPLTLGAALPRAMAKRMGPEPNLGSTLQSIRRRQRSEIDFLNGAVVAAAGRISRDAPVNAGLVDAVHEVEHAGEFLDAAAAAARFLPLTR